MSPSPTTSLPHFPSLSDFSFHLCSFLSILKDKVGPIFQLQPLLSIVDMALTGNKHTVSWTHLFKPEWVESNCAVCPHCALYTGLDLSTPPLY